jgi:leucyl aminopeptidase (aminopeptidase T)
MGLEEGARQIMGPCLNVASGEHVLVVCDAPVRRVGAALLDAATEREAAAVLAILPPLTHDGQEPPEHLAKAMLECEVVVLATTHSMTHTRARRAANRAGARVLSVPGVTEGMVSEGALTADFAAIQRTMGVLGRRLRHARTVHVTSPLGTDFVFDVVRRAWITEDTGVCRKAGDTTTHPAGEIFIAPREGTAEGRLVIDRLFHEVLTEPATVTLRDGFASRVVGAHSAVLEMNKGGRDGRNLGKFGMGLNPRARRTGNVREEEKVLGGAHIVFGDNAVYGGRVRCGVRVDALLTEAKVEVDGVVVLEKGVVV